MKKRLLILAAILCLLFSCAFGEALPKEDLLPSESFREMLDENPEIELYMRESIGLAAQINPDRETNPVQSLEEIYDFIDYSVTCMPWNIMNEERYSSFATKCDQSILYLYWLMDQPLTALEDKGLFYPSVEYLEPVYKWLTEYNNTWRDFLDTPDSWKQEYFDMLLEDPTWNLDKGWYEPSICWHTFNEFFSRKLSGPEARPITEPDNDTVVAAPADSLPQGVWRIDGEGKFEADPIKQEDGVVIKDSCFITVEQLLGEEGTAYASRFNNGYLTHTYLNYDDYHRYHSPVSGTVKAAYIIPYANAVGGVVYWNPDTQLYVLESNSLSWQSCETRGVVLIETEEYGMAALIPVGMGQVSSVNLVVEPGMEIQKGDEIGYFLFGGSDCVMLFEEKSGFMLTVPEGGSGSYSGGYAHVLCREEYGRFEAK